MDLAVAIVLWILGVCVRFLELVVSWYLLVLLAPKAARLLADRMSASVAKRERERGR